MWILTLAFLSYFPGYRLVEDLPISTGRLMQSFKISQTPAPAAGARAHHLRAGNRRADGGFFPSIEFAGGHGNCPGCAGYDCPRPFVLGHSRLLNHETVMAAFILISMLAVLVYLYPRRRISYLLLRVRQPAQRF